MVTNGRIPVSEMVLRQGLYLWPSTAHKFDLMDAWLVSLGYDHMVITQPYGGYRSIADQIKVKAEFGKGAATPGYSNHGLGTAWDIYNIGHYPDSIIAQAGVKFGLRRDAGNGVGGIESWHMHDYNGIVPAGEDIDPIVTPPVQKRKKSMSTLYHDQSTLVNGKEVDGTTLYALAGDSPGTPANWLETKGNALAVSWALDHGNSALLSHDTFIAWKAAYLSPVKTTS